VLMSMALPQPAGAGGPVDPYLGIPALNAAPPTGARPPEPFDENNEAAGNGDTAEDRTMSAAIEHHPSSAAPDNPDPQADAEAWALVAAAQTGDVGAFGQLYDRYLSTVYRFIYYRLGDRVQAEDLTSETFVRALRRLSSLTNQGRDPAAWLVTIARNLILDHVKSARYRLEVSTDELLEPNNPTADADSPETMVLAGLTNARLIEAIRELSDEQRECIVLRFLHGLSVSETARVMGKNDGAIKAMQHRAVRRLHVILKDELS
jgi:RNA polymerase sigma-70 factor, ECF subfamily